VVSQAVEIIKAVAELLKPIWWPGAVFASVWITRHELRALIKRISKLRIGHKDTTADIELAPELATAAEAVLLSKRQAQTVMFGGRAVLKTTSTGDLTVTNAQKEKAIALGASMENDLKSLETLAAIAGQVPRAGIEESWEILEKNVIETAKIWGYRRDEEGGSDLRQAVHYLTVSVLNSQDVMIGVYALATGRQKVEKRQDADVSPKEAQSFVKYCMAIVFSLSLKVNELIGPENPDKGSS